MSKLINRIKLKGYWRVIIRPSVYSDSLFSVQLAEELIRKCQVGLRGWDYPHIDREGIVMADEKSLELACNWPEGPVFEYWRFYNTGQFVHYFSLREDLRIDHDFIAILQKRHRTDSTKFLDILSTIYTVTEVYLFASRLASALSEVNEWSVTIELHDAHERTLMFWEGRRALYQAYTCGFEKNVIKLSKQSTRADLINNFADIALDELILLFTAFNWKGAQRNIIAEDQKKFLERRI